MKELKKLSPRMKLVAGLLVVLLLMACCYLTGSPVSDNAVGRGGSAESVGRDRGVQTSVPTGVQSPEETGRGVEPTTEPTAPSREAAMVGNFRPIVLSKLTDDATTAQRGGVISAAVEALQPGISMGRGSGVSDVFLQGIPYAMGQVASITPANVSPCWALPEKEYTSGKRARGVYVVYNAKLESPDPFITVQLVLYEKLQGTPGDTKVLAKVNYDLAGAKYTAGAAVYQLPPESIGLVAICVNLPPPSDGVEYFVNIMGLTLEYWP